MKDDFTNYDVQEDDISDEELAALFPTLQEQLAPTSNANIEKRTRQDPVPVNLHDYLNKLQFASIKKLRDFGWELMFIRRSNPNEIRTFMYFPSSGATALIEADGTVNKSHGVHVRKQNDPTPEDGQPSTDNHSIDTEPQTAPESTQKQLSPEKNEKPLDNVKKTAEGTFEVHGVIFETRDEAESFSLSIQRLRMQQKNES